MSKKSKNSKSSNKSSFVGNLSRSAGSVLKDTAGDLMPNLTSAIKSNSKFIKNSYKETTAKFGETSLKDSFLYKSGQNAIKNAMSDIKSGNINNKDRQKKNSEDPFDKLLSGFDSAFDSSSTDGLDDAFGGESDSSSSNSINVNSFNLDLDSETKSDIKAMANFSQANTKISNRGFAAMTTQLRAISTFQNQNTLKFYEMVEERLNKMEEHLSISSAYYRDVAENNSKSRKGEMNEKSLEKAYGMRGFNIQEWADIYKDNVKEMMDAGSMLGSMMIKPMIADFANNPLGALAKMGLKKVIPKGFQNSLKDIDKTFGMLPILLQGKIPALKEKGGIWELLGNVLDLNKNRVKAKNKYTKGPVSFDGVTKRAITHVIPGYLKRILHVLSGNDKDRISYDYDKGRFISDKDAKDGYKDKLDRSLRDGIDGNVNKLESQYIKALKSKKLIKNDDDAMEVLEELRKNMSEMSRNGKTLSGKTDVADFTSDTKRAGVLKEILSTLDPKATLEVNQAMADAYMNYQQTLRNVTSEDLWQEVYDHQARNKKKDPSIDDFRGALEYSPNKSVKHKSSLLEKAINKITNKDLKGGLSWIVDETDDGKNKALNSLNERFTDAFRGEVENSLEGKKGKKKRKKGNRKNASIDNKLDTLNLSNILNAIGGTGTDNKLIFNKLLKGDVNGASNAIGKLIRGTGKAAAFANNGLFQYATMTDEGFAIKVKVVSGSIETTEGVSEVKNIEKNIDNREKAEEKVNKKKDKKKAREDAKKEQEATKQEEAEKDKKEKEEEKAKKEEEKAEESEVKKSIKDEILGDLGLDPTDPLGSLKRKAKDIADGKLDDHPMFKKYGGKAIKAIMGSKAYATVSEKLKNKDGILGNIKDNGLSLIKSIAGKKIKVDEEGKPILDENGKPIYEETDRWKKLINLKNKTTEGFQDTIGRRIGRMGISKDMLKSEGGKLLNTSGGMLGTLFGNTGKVISGDMSIMDGLKSGMSGVGNIISGGFHNAGRGFKLLGRMGDEKRDSQSYIDRMEAKRAAEEAARVAEAARQEEYRDKKEKEYYSNKADLQQKILDAINDNNDISRDTKEATEKGLEEIVDATNDVAQTTAASAVGGASGDEGTSQAVRDMLGKTKLGKKVTGIMDKAKGKFGKLGKSASGKLGKFLPDGMKSLFSGGKGMSSLLTGGKGLSSIFSGAKGLGSLAKGAKGLGSLAKGASLVKGATGLTGLLSAAGPALMGALPVLGPLAAGAAGIWGVSKLAKGLFKKKPRKDENGNVMYDENGEPITESLAGRMVRGVGSTVKGIGKGLLAASPIGIGMKIIKKTNSKAKTPMVDSMGQPMYDAEGNPMYEEDNIAGGKGGPGQDSSNKPGVLRTMFNMTPAGMLYNLMKKDNEDEARLGENSKDPMTRTAEFLKPLSEFMKSPSFANIFGVRGLFNSMFSGLKSANGGSSSKLGNLFESMWNKLTGKDSSSSSSSSSSGSSSSTNTGLLGALTSVDQIINKNLKVKTDITAEQLDATFQAMGKTEMVGLGKAFIKASEESGLDPLYLVSHAALETGWGTSEILNDKNNWYGIGAFDSSPYESAYGFSNKEAGIIEGAKWIARNYTNEGQDTLYSMRFNNGVHEYATDPEWANKIGSIMQSVASSANVSIMGNVGGSSSSSSSSGSADLVNGFPYFAQTEEPWANMVFEPSSGHGPFSDPYFKQRACGPTSAAMITQGLVGKGSPRELADFATKGGYSWDAGTSNKFMTDFASKYGIGSKYYSSGGVTSSLLQTASPSNPLIINGQTSGAPYYGGHFMTAVGTDSNGNVLVNDPLGRSSSTSYNPASLARLTSNAWQYSVGGKGGAGKGGASASGSFMSQQGNLNKFNSRRNHNAGKGGSSASGSTSYASRSQDFMDETRNSYMLKIKDMVETISKNTGETNHILTKILETMLDSVKNSKGADIPLAINNDMAALFRGL